MDKDDPMADMIEIHDKARALYEEASRKFGDDFARNLFETTPPKRGPGKRKSEASKRIDRLLLSLRNLTDSRQAATELASIVALETFLEAVNKGRRQRPTKAARREA